MMVLLWLFMIVPFALSYVFSDRSGLAKGRIEGLSLSKRDSLQQVGPYTLYGMTEDQVFLMWTLLDNLAQALQPVIKNANRTKPDGTPKPGAAFTTFFKDADNMAFVTALLSNVTAGASVVPPTDPPAQWQYITSSGSPVFVSLTRRGQFKFDDGTGPVDAFDYCTGKRVAFTVDVKPPFPFIFLCPFFWKGTTAHIAGDLPPPSVNGKPAPNCPRVNSARTRFEPTHTATNRLGFPNPGEAIGYELVEYRMWYLLEELAHHYTYVARGQTFDHYDINAAMLLSAGYALENAPSYTYYAAVVWGKCKNFPDLNAQKHPSHELLSEVRNYSRLPISISVKSVEVLMNQSSSTGD